MLTWEELAALQNKATCADHWFFQHIAPDGSKYIARILNIMVRENEIFLEFFTVYTQTQRNGEWYEDRTFNTLRLPRATHLRQIYELVHFFQCNNWGEGFIYDPATAIDFPEAAIILQFEKKEAELGS